MESAAQKPTDNPGNILNVTITELFYSHILNVNRVSLRTKSFKRICNGLNLFLV